MVGFIAILMSIKSVGRRDVGGGGGREYQRSAIFF
jgi:hypothetical protein